MNMQIDYETERELGIDYEALAVKVADKVLEMEKCPYEAQVNLVLTDNDEIKRVNTEFRDIERATDVLSFPMIPFEVPAGYDIVEEDESYFDLDTDELLLGDIMISVDKVFAQAEEYGHSVTREFCFLVAHSMLHLLGYDHMTPEEAAVMDGANLLQQIWYVELPAIKNIIVIQFILQAGNIMSIGFEKAYALQTDMNLPASEILSTYVYRIGLLNGDYGYSTAVGLFNSVVNVILLIFVNWVVKKLNDGEGL